MFKKINWKKLSKIENIIFLVLMFFVFYTQFPIIQNNFSKSGIKIPINNYQIFFPKKQQIEFPTQNKKILFFWSTTCPPCRLDMQRLKASVDNGKLKSADIFAINVYENPKEIETFLKKSPFPFTFLHAPDIVQFLEIKSTPTLVLLDANKVQSMSSGLSLIGIFRAEFFIN